jgi:hypothetical protein
MAITDGEMSAKSETATVQSLNSADGFQTIFMDDLFQSVSMLVLIFVMSYLCSAMRFYTYSLGRQYCDISHLFDLL